MQSNKTCPLVEQYLGYLVVIKGRSENTVKEYRTDLLMFFSFVMVSRNTPISDKIFAGVNLEFIKTISLNDMYTFITHCQTELHAAAGTRARRSYLSDNFGSISKLRLILLITILRKNWRPQSFPKGYQNT